MPTDAAQQIIDSIDFGDLDQSTALTKNTHVKHAPVILLIDSSWSTHETGADREITEGVNRLIEDLTGAAAGKLAKASLDLCIIRYFNDRTETDLAWTPGDDVRPISHRSGDGNTPMAKGLNEAANAAYRKLKAYQEAGVEAYCGAVFNITDGAPTDMQVGDSTFENVRKWMQSLEYAGSAGHPYFQFIHLATDGADVGFLNQLAVRDNRVFDLRAAELSKIFQALSVSLSNLDDAAGPAEALAEELS